MGTRGALCFVIDGAEKTVYSHFDSYPSALGENVARWLRDALKSEQEVRTAVSALRPVGADTSPSLADIERLAPFHDPKVSSGTDWYALLRHTQGDPGAILRAGVYEDAAAFPLDSLWCEWAYVVDFDERRFEVYQGFRNGPTSDGRWAGHPANRDGYYPVQRVAAWTFDDMPDLGEVAGADSEDPS